MFTDSPRVSYTIVTYPRPAAYLDKTIKSLESTGFFKASERLPLWLVGGSPDSSHLKPYLSDKRFLVDPMTDQEAKDSHWHIAGGGYRAIIGHRRALHPLKVNPGAQYILVMEDDIQFAKGWIPRFEKTLKEVIKKFSDRFLLSLYSPGDGAQLDPVLLAYKSGKLWVDRVSEKFYGVQGILYPTIIRDAYIYETSARPIDQERGPGKSMDRAYGHPHDLLLPMTMGQLRIPIVATAPSLVQHIGLESGAQSPEHTSKSFLETVV